MPMIEAIKSKAKQLLEDGEIQCFIGYARASDGLTARPAFIYSPAEVEKLIFDKTCVHNLSRYLLDKKDKKVGILVKPCDSRSINILLQEKKLDREKVYIIGVVCEGVYRVSFGEPGQEVAPHCQLCLQHTPVIYDFLVGERQPEQPPFPSSSKLEELEAKDLKERWNFWQELFSRCIRCYACRQVCPSCYCPECFVEQLDPQWVGIRIDLPRNMVWHMGRAVHLAARCVGCGECERVCPMGIPLMLLNHKLNQETKKLFDYIPGLSPDVPCPLATFLKEEDIP